jgi:methyl-accepting chemotaxis protein
MNKLLSNVNIGTKVYGLIGILLLAIAAASGSGIYQMSKIGDELHAVTTQDMPLTTILTTITTHQLEQAVLFERGVAIGARLATDPSQKGHFVEVEHEFVELGHKVEAEMKQGEELLADAVKHATSEEARKES